MELSGLFSPDRYARIKFRMAVRYQAQRFIVVLVHQKLWQSAVNECILKVIKSSHSTIGTKTQVFLRSRKN